MMKKTILAFVLLMAFLCAVGAFADDMKTITLVDGASTSNADGVVIDGDVIHIMKAGEYVVSGTLGNGQISVECTNDAKVKLFFNGVNIHYETGPALYIFNGLTRLTISLVNQTNNVLSNGENLLFTESENEPNGVIYSKSDLTVSGSGSLTVTAGAMDGIVSKDDLRIKGGHVIVTAPRHGIRGKDYVEITSASVTVNAGVDGLRTTAKDREDRGYISIDDSELTLCCGDDVFAYVTGLTINNSSITCIPAEDD